MAENLSAGVRVRLHSLQAAAQHNGVDGHLLKWNASTGRWGVKLSTGQELSVRPANVMPTCSHAGGGQRIGASEAAGAGLRTCAKCRQVVYCSRACQKAAWKGGHKQECEALQQERGTGSGRAAAQEALRAALFGTTKKLQLEKQMQVSMKMNELHSSNKYWDVLEMVEEGLAVAEELRSESPGIAAIHYYMLGDSLIGCQEYAWGLRLLELARALAVEAGNRSVLGKVLSSLGAYHERQGEHAKAIAKYKKSRAINMELGNRQDEAGACGKLGLSYMSLKRYDKAIELLEQSFAILEELGDRSEQAKARVNLGMCLSRHGQHDRAVVCLKKAWAVDQELGDALDQTPTAFLLGEALWAQARAEHHQAAPDATGCGGISDAGSDTLQEAETWLRTALDLAVKQGTVNFRMDGQMHLACVAMFKGNEDEAVELLSQHLQGWVDDVGPKRCAGCGQTRASPGEDAPMLSCDCCRVARCVYMLPHSCRAASSAMLAVRWLTGRRGRVMQVLQ